jgi:2,3-bisphosphoglycerate-dependent phosphoglycerate mutase
MKIFLVRHGQSEANVDKSVYLTTADHAIQLSSLGRKQAAQAGSYLSKYFNEHNISGEKIRLWTSPYLRTRETADSIEEACGQFLTDRCEDILLCEQQFGLFDGIPDEELSKHFPKEYEHYEKCKEHEGEFWARMPLGESRFDVALRIRLFFGTIQRDAEKHNIHNVIVVCHGVTLRAFVMSWRHHNPEWFEGERNPTNCAIRLLSDDEDRGYIFKADLT